MPIKKNKILLDIEHETLVELRKVLFKHGVSVQGFFSYVSDLISMRDPAIEAILERMPKTKHKTKTNKADANTLYALIEQEIQKKQNGA